MLVGGVLALSRVILSLPLRIVGDEVVRVSEVEATLLRPQC